MCALILTFSVKKIKQIILDIEVIDLYTGLEINAKEYSILVVAVCCLQCIILKNKPLLDFYRFSTIIITNFCVIDVYIHLMRI